MPLTAALLLESGVGGVSLVATASYLPSLIWSIPAGHWLHDLIALLPFTGPALAAALSAIQLVAGVGLGSANVLSITLRQTVIPHDQLARTIGAYRFLMYGSIPLGSSLGGLVGEAFGGRTGVALGAGVMAVSALPMLARPIRTLRSPVEARTSESTA